MQEISKARVLFVDDEPDLLAAIVRSLRSEHFEITTAASGAEALDMLRKKGPFAVIVSDLHMPEIDGVELLRRARKLSPETVRVLFTGQPDLERSIAAVNEGEIFRFITKPCARVPLALLLKAAVHQYQLITAERVLLEQTLRGCIQALTEILALTSPLAFGRASRLRQGMASLITAVGIPLNWHLEVATMLSQIGGVLLPPALLEKVYAREPLSEGEQETIDGLPKAVEEILGNIPRLEPVLEILRYQDKHFNGEGPPPDLVAGEIIPWGARALKVLLDLDALESEGYASSQAFEMMRERRGWYDPKILSALAELRQGAPEAMLLDLPANLLRAGMILAQNVRTSTGMVFIAKGQEVTASLLLKLRNLSPGFLADELIRVIVGGAKENTPATPVSQ
jgi:response regulator RpfG family c-di-GMP phosphodiesterase